MYHLKLRQKIFASVMLVVFIAFLALYILITNRDTAVVKEITFEMADEMAEKYKNEIIAELQMAHATAETLSYTFQALNNNGYTNRKMMNVILQENLERKPYITAFCIAYEPNALDGMDRSYAGSELYGETGRYAPYWNKLGENIEAEPLAGIDGSDWYEIPKATKKEFIMEPYKYHLQNSEIMLMSFFFPIIKDDEFLGIIASDVSLETLQEIVTRPNTHAEGGFSVIYSSSGMVAAHANPDKLAVDLYDVLPDGYSDSERLTVTAEARTAIQEGRKYVTSNSKYYTVFLPVKFSDATEPWSVSISLSTKQMLQSISESRNYILTVSSISLIGVGILIFLISSGVTKPILMLSDSAKAISSGNFELPLPVRKGSDEIAILTKSFAAMSEQIKNLIKKMQDYTLELENNNARLNTMNEDLLSAKEQAERSSHAKSDFLSNMSHEMRTPLNAIIGMTAIGEKADSIEKKNYSFHKIEDASTHMLGVINDILDMSKIEANKLELSNVAFSLNKMLERVINFINFRVEERHLNFITDIDEKIPGFLIGDDQRLAQMLTNLLSNAVKFTPENGSVTLTAKYVGYCGCNACRLRFAVTDTGIGISKAQQATLFQSFQQADSTTSRKFGGTGLGLAISKRIVELMDGKIWIESEEGQGATFIAEVKLEKSVAPVDIADDSDTLDAQKKTYDFNGYCILLADDIEINREIVIELLAPTKLVIDCAENGTEVLQCFTKAPDRYDLILMDVQMPEMDGLTATQEIRKMDFEKAKTIPIIAMTANVFKEDVEHCRNAGMNDHLGKPLVIDEVQEKLKIYLGKVERKVGE